jgi:hypothetical protein
MGEFTTGKFPRFALSLARGLLMALLVLLVTQILTPSKTTPCGPVPTEKVSRLLPSLARSLVTALL